jgi:hypothetical protein
MHSSRYCVAWRQIIQQKSRKEMKKWGTDKAVVYVSGYNSIK